MSLIHSYIDSQVALITLADSSNDNRLNPKMLQGLTSAFTCALMDKEARVIMLRSAGRDFCLGMDLARLQSGEIGESSIEEAVSLYADLLHTIHLAPKPVVCLLQGDVKAGGVGLVCACDIVLASDKATFELSEVLFGLIPANVFPFLLSSRVSPQKARYLTMASKNIKAEEAHRLNLIDEVFPEENLESGARDVIRRLLRASPQAIAETKSFTHLIRGSAIDQAQELAKAKTLELLRKPEVTEAIGAFQDGTIPQWFSRYKPEKPLVCGQEKVIVEVEDTGIAYLKMNDVVGRNTFSGEFVDALVSGIDELENKHQPKVVILQGLSDVFCGGAEKQVLLDLCDGKLSVKDLIVVERLVNVPFPIIAAMEGHAMGGGLAVALCCDVVLAAMESRYGAVFMTMGFTPGMGCTKLLEELVGPYIANEMMFTGKRFKGSELATKGTNINYILPKEQLLPKARDIAMRISENSKQSIYLLKTSLSAQKKKLLIEARVQEDLMHRVTFALPETKGAINALYVIDD
ncbi:MAG: enoyl-CoA hydratase/isomerase family protein [Chloroflexota bacterium]|nr:enoyl-CoA hydratase/isomerase family protein [Chloroflexota bacterium]